MILTLSITLIIEGIIALGYCLWCKKPLQPILLTSICGNLVTQSLLWAVLSVFFQNYLITLFFAEIVIWLLESTLLSIIPANQLRFTDALFLSLAMNLMSFGVGWFLPV